MNEKKTKPRKKKGAREDQHQLPILEWIVRPEPDSVYNLAEMEPENQTKH